MNRKEFIQHLGVGSLFLLGGGMFYQAIATSTQQGKMALGGKTTNGPISRGYGKSSYGGNRLG